MVKADAELADYLEVCYAEYGTGTAPAPATATTDSDSGGRGDYFHAGAATEIRIPAKTGDEAKSYNSMGIRRNYAELFREEGGAAVVALGHHQGRKLPKGKGTKNSSTATPSISNPQLLRLVKELLTLWLSSGSAGSESA
ncbi:unnamed protein product, partial [Amoebophrya sp. A120]|eukprot:GSA120T00021906001.1